jgi:predicted nucleic acid-binding protein
VGIPIFDDTESGKRAHLRHVLRMRVRSLKLKRAKPGFVSVVVMAEIAWVLDRAYGFARQDIAAAIGRHTAG